MRSKRAAAIVCFMALSWFARSAAAELVYVTNGDDDSVAIVDSASNEVVDTVPVGDEPVAITVSADRLWAWVVNLRDPSVSIIDTETATVESTVPLPEGSTPRAVALTLDGSKGYVSLANDGSVAVIDAALALSDPQDAIVTTIEVGTDPGFLATSPGGKIYVSRPGGFSVGLITEIDPATNAVATSIEVGPDPAGIGFSPDGDTAYVAAGGVVTVVDLVQRIAIDEVVFGQEGSTTQNNQGIAVAPGGQVVYVSNNARSAVGLLITSTNAIGDSYGVSLPSAIAVSSGGTRLYVAQEESDQLAVIDTGTGSVIASVPVGDHPNAVAIVRGAAEPTATSTSTAVNTATATPTATATAVATSTATAIPPSSGGGCAAAPGAPTSSAGLFGLALAGLLLRRRATRA